MKGVFLCLQHEIRQMLKTGGGAIVNTASIAGVIADPGMAPYVTANVEAYIQFKPGLISADGKVTDEGTEKFLSNYMTELHDFIVRVLTVLPRSA